MARVIGIDLGTTFSAIAYVNEHGGPEVLANADEVLDGREATVIPNAEGSRTTPSVVSFGKDGERRVGNVAKRQAVTNPENTIFAIKRLMGRRFDSAEAKRHASVVPYEVTCADNGDAWANVHGKAYSPPEISAFILQEMKKIASSYLGEEVGGGGLIGTGRDDN